MDKLSALMQALSMTGKAGLDIGKHGLKAGVEFSKANPRTAAGIGGVGGGAALTKILSRDDEQPEVDAESQEEILRRMRYGGM